MSAHTPRLRVPVETAGWRGVEGVGRRHRQRQPYRITGTPPNRKIPAPSQRNAGRLSGPNATSRGDPTQHARGIGQGWRRGSGRLWPRGGCWDTATPPAPAHSPRVPPLNEYSRTSWGTIAHPVEGSGQGGKGGEGRRGAKGCLGQHRTTTYTMARATAAIIDLIILKDVRVGEGVVAGQTVWGTLFANR